MVRAKQRHGTNKLTWYRYRLYPYFCKSLKGGREGETQRIEGQKKERESLQREN